MRWTWEVQRKQLKIFKSQFLGMKPVYCSWWSVLIANNANDIIYTRIVGIITHSAKEVVPYLPYESSIIKKSHYY